MPLDLGQHLAPAEPEHGAVEDDVVGAGQLGVEARPHLDQGGDVAADREPAGCRRIDPRQQPQQSALAGAVAADDAHALALVDLEADVASAPRTRTRGTGDSRRKIRSSAAA